jgi:hypothetical protein
VAIVETRMDDLVANASTVLFTLGVLAWTAARAVELAADQTGTVPFLECACSPSTWARTAAMGSRWRQGRMSGAPLR